MKKAKMSELSWQDRATDNDVHDTVVCGGGSLGLLVYSIMVGDGWG